MAAEPSGEFDLVILEDAPQVQRTGRRAPAYTPTPEELQRATQLHAEGHTKTSICEQLGWRSWRFEELRRPGGLLAHLPSRQGAGGGRHPKVPGSRISDAPSPEQLAAIEVRKLEVQARWSDAERLARMGYPVDNPTEAQGYAPQPPRGICTVRPPHRR